MHAPLKKKTLRGNQAPFLSKEPRKEIYTRSKLKNKYNRNLTEENKTIYKNKEIHVYIYDEKRLKCISIM